MKMRSAARWWVTLAMCASACMDRARESEPVPFAQSAGGAGVADGGAATVVEAERSQPMDTMEVDRALALSATDGARPRRILLAGMRWDARFHRADPTDTPVREHAAREALRAYDALVGEHPADDAIAEALFRAAQIEADSHRMDRARRRYLLLIQRFPASPFVPFAYLSFGDFFTQQQDWDSARQFYERVRSMSPGTELAAYTNYRLARAHWAQSRCVEALQCLQLVLAAPTVTISVRDAATSDRAAIGSCRAAMPPLGESIPVEVPQPPYTSVEALEASDS
ncbi:MAG: tetratricopeptide repeat protein [Polyangiales bacterium]